ncbi:MAG TPA: peptide chain release factor N(5)-glutamine methyltransferase, partial [Bacteroidota bacterium]|nr:peptide chain release factor N(5)-glutamine methyltransferase [Bacteroidota bacterium]
MPPPESAPARVWTVLALLEWADGYLRERHFGESRLNAELLLAHALGLPRLGLYLQFDRPLAPEE